MNFITKKLLEKQLKNVPADQREMIMTLVEKNPKLFKQIGEEIKAKQKAGLDQQTASMSVMMAHKDEIQKLLQQK